MSDIGDRIKEAAKAVGGLNRLAQLLPMPRRTLGDKISGKTELGVGLLIDISRITRHTVQWLATGTGPRTIDELDDPAAAILERGTIRDRLREDWELTPDLEPVANDYSDNSLSFELIHPDVLADIGEIIRQVHKDAGITLPTRVETQMVATQYNDFLRGGIDLSDEEEISARLVLMRKQLLRDVAAARKEPGIGKRSA